MRKMIWEPKLPAPAHYPGVVLEVHDGDRADVLLFSGQQPVTLPNIPHLPGMELKRGYRVAVSTFGYECCVTAVVGFMTDEQIAGTYELAEFMRREEENKKAARKAEWEKSHNEQAAEESP